jgi:hypothetical protein
VLARSVSGSARPADRPFSNQLGFGRAFLLEHSCTNASVYTAANHSLPADTPLGFVLALTALPLTEQQPFVTLPRPVRRTLARLFRWQALRCLLHLKS